MAPSTIFLHSGVEPEPCEDKTKAARALAEGLAHPPSSLFAAVYEKAALSGAYPDNKMLADAIPRSDPEEIVAAFKADPPDGPEAFRTFLNAHFDLDPPTPPFADPPAGLGMASHRHTVGALDARVLEGRGQLLTSGAAGAVHRAGRAIHRDLLLGQLFHHAGPE
ncbi:MAG: hypothetical protein ACOC20_03810 [Oceanicaulis sp.]